MYLRVVEFFITKDIVDEGCTSNQIDYNHNQEQEISLALLWNFFFQQWIGVAEGDDQSKEANDPTSMVYQTLHKKYRYLIKHKIKSIS